MITDTLIYSSGKLHTFTTPGPTASGRTATVAITAGRMTSITDPDTSTVSFTYLTTASDSNRVQAVTNKLSVPTEYAYDATHHLALDSTNLVTFPTIAERFRDVDSVELATNGAPIVPDSAYVSIDGPRTDVRDVTRFWLDRHGAPLRIIDALGDSTILTRADPRWPALVSRMRSADGRIVLATYSVRGNDSTTIDSLHIQNGVSATTRYLFDNSWDFVTRIVQPMGDSVMLAYDATTGNRLYQQPGGDQARRVTFGYDAMTKLLRSIQAPLTSRADSVYYDATLGNDSVHVSPRGIRSYVTRDLSGRIVHTKSPIDSGQSLFEEQDLTYDALDRMLSTQTYGPSIHYHLWASGSANGISTLAERTILNRYFDREGNLDSLSRSAQPDTARMKTITTRWVYDRANRMIEEVAPDGLRDSTGRDAAGNAIVVKTRRTAKNAADTTGLITMQYDAANRLVQRQLPQVLYFPGHISDQVVSPIWTFPRYTAGYFIPADVETYSYDAMGRITSAANASALVRRTYNIDGTLATDTLRIRNYASTDSSQHAYGLEYTYDLDGRRTSIRHPDALAPVVGGVLKDMQTYGYDSVTGALSSVTDVLGNTFRYTYDIKGRLDTLVSPGGVREFHRYDDDDNLILRVDSATQFVGQAGGFPTADIHRDSLVYDARGNVVEARSLVDTARFGYSALGSLADAATIPASSAYPAVLSGLETFYVNDALGNRVWTWFNNLQGSDSTTTAQISFYMPNVGRDTAIESNFSGFSQSNTPVYERIKIYADSAGNVVYSSVNHGTNGSLVHETDVPYFDALNRMRVLDKRACNTSSNNNQPLICNFSSSLLAADKGYFEEYRYDALGRRILLRSRSDSTCPSSSNQCVSIIQRTIYDGDQVLYELQMPGADSISPAQLERDTTSIYALNLPFGRVAYTHGVGIDRPLDVIRMGYSALWAAPVAVVPHSTWQGQYDAGSYDDGRAGRCTNYAADSTCVHIQWPAPFYGYFLDDLSRSLNYPIAWFGSLLSDRRDPSGKIYLRNRYYDPESGRFTQEDPLGLAGGLNVYGFGQGDPVNYSDPLGLRPLTEQERSRMGNLCEEIDCDKINIHEGHDSEDENKERMKWLGRSRGAPITIGDDVYIPDGSIGDFGTLAHELTHVYQYHVDFGSNLRKYELTLFFGDQAPYWLFRKTKGRLGKDPYDTGNMSGKSFDDYPYEGQASIVEQCFTGNPWACSLAPIHPIQ